MTMSDVIVVSLHPGTHYHRLCMLLGGSKFGAMSRKTGLPRFDPRGWMLITVLSGGE